MVEDSPLWQVSFCPTAGVPLIEGCGWTTAMALETLVVKKPSAVACEPRGVVTTRRKW